MYRLNYVGRKLDGATRSGDGFETSFSMKSTQWLEFLDWNAKQPAPLDLSDRAPDPIPRDIEREQIEAILNKADGDIAAPEVKTLLVKFLRRARARGQL